VVFNNKIWVIGGYDGTNRRNDVWNSSNGITWSKVSDAPFIGRAYHTSVVFNGKIWVMAGNNEDYLSDVWCSSDGVTWVKNTPVSESFSARNKHSSCVFNNKIWVINGYNSANTYLNDIWTTGTN
jgi:N-acetylneuraminic acid mutarotase